MATTFDSSGISIVLVHGGFVDGSGWEGVYQILKKEGYDVRVVQNPTESLAEIASLVGFSDSSHFSRAFLEIVGTTPSAWLRQRS